MIEYACADCEKVVLLSTEMNGWRCPSCGGSRIVTRADSAIEAKFCLCCAARVSTLDRCPRCGCERFLGGERPIRTERIFCAAVWVDTGYPSPCRPHENYPETGILFCGRGHGDCFVSLEAWDENLPLEQRERIGAEQLAGLHQGFQTSTGRFVDRREAAVIAWRSGQLNEPKDSLDSEDIVR